MKNFLTGLLLIFVMGVNAQDEVFRATVSANRVAVNGNFQITFTLENADGKNFAPPSFKDFQVIGGPNQSTSMQFINGDMSRSVSYSYYLRPIKEGKFTIDPATIQVKGKTISTNSISIEAVAGAQSQAPQGGGQQQQGQQRQQTQSQQQDLQTQISESVFVKLSVDKTDVYQGEQLTATYKLYVKADIANTSVSKAPSYTGFWSQAIEELQNVQFRPEVYNGMQFNTAVIKQDALFPQRSGQLEVDPIELETVVRVRVQNQQRGFFDDFFGSYQNYPFKFSSNKVKVNVKPLPANKPASFKGAVGVFGMEVTPNKTETRTDDPVALTVKVTGTGNIKMLDVPTIDLPQDFEVFEPKSSENINKKSGDVSGSKSYEYLVIPRRPGQFKLPTVEFSYFDLKKEEYVVLQSPEYMISVTGEATTSTPAVTGISKEEVELLGEDIRYIKTGETDFREKGEFLLASWNFAGYFASPFLLFLILLVWKRREDKLSGNVALVKSRRANKEAAKRLKKAKQFLSAHDKKGFYDEIARATWGYLGDKLNIDQSSLSREQVEKVLKEKNVSDEIIKQAFKILDDSEMALFSPSSDGEMQNTFEAANDLISKLEGGLKG